MHRCLQIYEIVHDIVNILACHETTGPGDLLALAIVSRTFNEPAMECLWAAQDSLPVLIKTFPQDLWIESGNPKLLTFRRPLTQSDLDRYLFYGKKMRKLRVEETWDLEHPNGLSLIHSTVFRAITTFIDLFQPGLAILPKLRELHCLDSQCNSFWDIIPYLSPSVQVFVLQRQSGRSAQPNPSSLALLSALTMKSPSIRELRVQFYSNSMRDAAPAAFTCGFLHLSKFELSGIPVSRDVIRHLACLSNLCDVSLYFEDSNSSTLSTITMPAVPFPSLRTLKLNCNRFGSGIEFIHTCLRSATLSSVTVSATYVPSTGETYQLFSALSSRLVQSMTSLRVFAHGRRALIGSALQFNDFEPLLQCSNLELLHVDINCDPEHLSDGLLDAMSIAWPRLTLFYIGSLHPAFVSNPSQCTLEGILLFAKRCPKLRSLTLPFLASAEITWNGRPGGGAVNEYTELLDVGRSPIVNPHMMASFLSDIFPNLISILAWKDLDREDPEHARMAELWEETIILYDGYKIVRKEERAWAHQGLN